MKRWDIYRKLKCEGWRICEIAREFNISTQAVRHALTYDEKFGWFKKNKL